MKPFRMWLGGSTRYSSIQMRPRSSVTSTPPADNVEAQRLEGLVRGLGERAVAGGLRGPTSSDRPLPCARPEYHGAFSSCRYGQSKWCIHTGTPMGVRRQRRVPAIGDAQPGRAVAGVPSRTSG